MKRILILSVLGLAAFSCSDLDTFDRRALPQEVILADVSGYQSFLNAAYESVNDFGYYGQTMMIGPEILADNMELIQLTGRYELEYVNAENSGLGIWFNRYNGINEVNIVIGTIDNESVVGTQEEKDAIKGQALFLRALFYHDLARVYGYEPGQEVNGFEQSVILNTNPVFGLADVPDIPRATNDEVYAQIITDLTDAIALLDDADAGSGDVIFANANAARLLLARVYLYQGDMTNAAAQATSVITGDGSDLVQAADYVDSWDDGNNPIHPESLFESEIRLVDWNSVDGFNNSLYSLLTNDDPAGNQFIIAASDELITEIENQPSDVRRGMFNTEAALGGVEEFQKWRAINGARPGMENIPILRLSEAYLIAAEALGAGAGDAYINALRNARGITAPVSATVNNVLRERRIEFMAEGHRWFDLKRLGRDIPKPAASLANTLPYSDHKVLPRIPQSEINLLSNLDQNPGYN